VAAPTTPPPSVALRPEKSGSKRAARAPAPAAEAPAPPAPDCTHPFFVDGDGIKKFRPECM
jgi:hypothetical protein